MPLARRRRVGRYYWVPEGVDRLRHLKVVKDCECSHEGGMGKPRLVYTPRQDARREGELNALAAVYKLVLDSAEKKVAHPCDQDDGKGDERAPVPRSVSPKKEDGTRVSG